MHINLALVEMSRGGVGTQKVSGHKPNQKSFRGGERNICWSKSKMYLDSKEDTHEG
jgi:hypothetical protein